MKIFAKPIVDAGVDQVIGCKITTANITANTASQNQKVWSTVNGNIISSNTLDRIPCGSRRSLYSHRYRSCQWFYVIR
ncbi:MAG: hypothetical protein IPL98_15500 [Saprospiraceae bacterium]|nr:hypothetical protein [Saprospiraceae bacterium]